MLYSTRDIFIFHLKIYRHTCMGVIYICTCMYQNGRQGERLNGGRKYIPCHIIA